MLTESRGMFGEQWGAPWVSLSGQPSYITPDWELPLQKFLSLGSGGWNSEIEALARLASSETSPPGLCVVAFSLRPERDSSHRLLSLCVSCDVLSHFSRVRNRVILWTAAHQSPLSTGFSRQEYLHRLPSPLPGDLPNPGIEPASLASPALASRFFTTSATGSHCVT